MALEQALRYRLPDWVEVLKQPTSPEDPARMRAFELINSMTPAQLRELRYNQAVQPYYRAVAERLIAERTPLDPRGLIPPGGFPEGPSVDPRGLYLAEQRAGVPAEVPATVPVVPSPVPGETVVNPQNVAPAPTRPSQAPRVPAVNPGGGATPPLPQQETNLPLPPPWPDKEPPRDDSDINERLMAFGFGMAASQNPGLFGMIGEGGLNMLQSDRGRRKEGREQRELDLKEQAIEDERKWREDYAEILRERNDTNEAIAAMRAQAAAGQLDRAAANLEIRRLQMQLESQDRRLNAEQRRQSNNDRLFQTAFDKEIKNLTGGLPVDMSSPEGQRLQQRALQRAELIAPQATPVMEARLAEVPPEHLDALRESFESLRDKPSELARVTDVFDRRYGRGLSRFYMNQYMGSGAYR